MTFLASCCDHHHLLINLLFCLTALKDFVTIRVLHLGGVVDFLLVSIKSNHMGIFLNNIKQWTNKMMLALDT